ncbi:hypothetical protein FRC18_011868 [Serendipita sp. 400]|nr:hypothetical protein FRC18_011868 [Serendipita sp. 400]
MPFTSQDNDDHQSLKAMVKELGRPLPDPARQELFAQRPNIGTRNNEAVSQSFRHLDHIPFAKRRDLSKGEHLRTVFKGVFKHQFWVDNVAPPLDCHVLDEFVEERTCMFCARQFTDDAQAMACVFLHINLHPQ